METRRPFVEATYDYTDELGKLLFQCVRMRPKDFRQRRPDGKGGWLWDLEGVRRVPYRLHSLVRSPGVVHLVEGEKDVHTLESLGVLASCSPLGAGKWLEEYSLHFRGRKVVIIPDNDTPGIAHAYHCLGSLISHGVGSVRLLRLPGLRAKQDVTDWVRALPATAARKEFAQAVSLAVEYVAR